ncbi:hypothetical protein [Cohnella thermotolerans]|jgi:hypothetical protein|uniref:hypothetical protein n=1 Tax=Cohnella thermotolerans TaxID=329858 RepID=UPI0003FF44B3|nr:hypothetical protein [Cohnella thermotolerans]
MNGDRRHGGHGGRGRRGGGEPGSDGRAGAGSGVHSAQTFRRGRAIAFLERLQVMRSTLAKQLNEPEFQSIQPVISGELKAIDNVIQAFIHTFELREEQEQSPGSDDPHKSSDSNT